MSAIYEDIIWLITKIMGKKKYTLKQWAIEHDKSILESWDYERNINIDINKVGYHSSKVVFWVCEKGHSYPARIHKKVLGHKCIYCSNRSLLKGYNDLATVYPEFVEEWDYELNNKQPSELRYTESYEAFWICSNCNNKWKSNVKNRVYNGCGCPKCGIKKRVDSRIRNHLSKTGGLVKKYPDLGIDWDYELNKGVIPEYLNISDKRKYWWKCKKENHSYNATISYKINNSKCKYCSNREVLVGFNDVKTKKSDLMDEWDYSKNEISPEEIIYCNTSMKVYWRCRYCGAEILSAPGNHNFAGCKSCRTKERHNHERIIKIKNGYSLNCNEFKMLYLDWDEEKNTKNDLHWHELTPSYTKAVFWKCHKCGYKWKTSIYKRVKEGTGCPACSHCTVFPGYNDLETLYPELVLEWSSNNKISPRNVLGGGTKKYLWVCRFCKNEWAASIHNRITECSNCPNCGGYGTSFPEQAIYYYFSKIFKSVINRYKDLESGKELDIYIEEKNIGIEYDGYEFHKFKSIKDDEKTDYFQKKGIKIIRIREYKSENEILPELLVTPFLCYEYNYRTKFTGLDKLIKTILNDLQIKYIFEINTYNERFEILHYMHQGLKSISLEQSGSDHIKFWDYDANKPLLPREISQGSGIEVNWKCDICGHKWIRSVNAEIKSKGCPVCTKSIVSQTYNLAVINPESQIEWCDNKNNGINPSEIMPNTHQKYWWICTECGEAYYASPPQWRKKHRCNKCSSESSRKKRCKKVGQYTLNNEFIREFESAREAYRITGINYKSISAVCNGGRKKQTGGYVWRFLD